MNANKLRLAGIFQRAGVNAALRQLQVALWRPHIRSINYHDVPPSRAAKFEAQLRFYARHFVPVGMKQLLALHEGHWPHSRPGLLMTFDDGLRSHAETVAPLLEKHGFTGWFFIPVGFPETPAENQAEWASSHDIYVHDEYADPRVAMSWSDVRRLSEQHVIGSHTMNHRRLAATLTREELDVEVFEAKRLMEERLGREVEVFCWVGGEAWSYSNAAAKAIREAGFRVAFMTNNALIRPGCDFLQLQRTNIEADDPLYLVQFQLSGFLDVMYLPKRRRVNRLTAASG